jgi:teichoic acid transport system permease protein
VSVPESELRPENDLPRPVAPELPDDPVATWPHLRRVGGPESLASYLRGVWRWRDFLVRLALAERRAQNQDSVLGQLWNLLNPLLLIAVYYLIFGVILGVESRRGVDHYLPFLIVGIIAFDYTRSTAQAGGQTMLKHRRLLQSISFPRAVMPLSALVSETMSYLYAIPVMLLLASLATGGPTPMPTWLLLLPILVIQGCFNLGVMMIVARIAARFRDITQFLPYVLRLLLYASGVLIPINAELITNVRLLTILELNPTFNLVEMARGAVLYGIVEPRIWITGTAWAIVTLGVGFAVFRRGEHEYSHD